MFDITSSKLLILAIVALLVVGPKDLPLLLRTVGKYLGVMRRHASEFRAQFDEAVREAELDALKKDVESVGREMQQTVQDGASAIEQNVETASRDVNDALEDAPREARVAEGEGTPPAADNSVSEKTGT